MNKVSNKRLQVLTNCSSEMEKLLKEIVQQRDKLFALTEQFNEQVQIASDTVDDIISDIHDYMDAKSEKWLESEKAEAYQEWLLAWQEIQLTITDFEIPEPEIDVNTAKEIIETINKKNLQVAPEI